MLKRWWLRVFTKSDLVCAWGKSGHDFLTFVRSKKVAGNPRRAQASRCEQRRPKRKWRGPFGDSLYGNIWGETAKSLPACKAALALFLLEEIQVKTERESRKRCVVTHILGIWPSCFADRIRLIRNKKLHFVEFFVACTLKVSIKNFGRGML